MISMAQYLSFLVSMTQGWRCLKITSLSTLMIQSQVLFRQQIISVGSLSYPPFKSHHFLLPSWLKSQPCIQSVCALLLCLQRRLLVLYLFGLLPSNLQISILEIRISTVFRSETIIACLSKFARTELFPIHLVRLQYAHYPSLLVNWFITHQSQFFQIIEIGMQVFHEQLKRIEVIQSFTTSLDERAVLQILNKEFFYHASRELTSHIPTDKPTTQTLADKLLQQLAARPEQDTLIQQLDHRIKVLLDPRGDQLQEISRKFAKDRDRMRECGARVRDYTEIYEEELREVSIPNGLVKKAIGYFQASSREWPLDEMLSDLIQGLRVPQEEEQASDSESFDEQTKQDMDSLLDQLKLVNSCFNFQT